jgi:hypothetical protein
VEELERAIFDDCQLPHHSLARAASPKIAVSAFFNFFERF